MEEKRRLSASELVSDLRKGLNDVDLMEKYDLTFTQLQKVLDKLVESGKLTRSELDARNAVPENLLILDDDSAESSSTITHEQQPSKNGRHPANPPIEDPGTGTSLPPPPPHWKRNAAIGIIAGFVIAIVNGIFLSPGNEGGAGDPILLGLTILLYIVSVGVQLGGCWYLVKGKGYHGALSILGPLCCIGLLILLILPNKHTSKRKSSSSTVLIVVGASLGVTCLVGIILAVAIPYYVLFLRTECDKMVVKDIGTITAVFERLKKEIVAKGAAFDEEAVSRAVDGDVLRYVVGPHYRFTGSNQRCKVIMRMNRHEGRWIVEGTSLVGRHPCGQTSRYVSRAYIVGPGDLPATVINNPADSRNGKSCDWNSYPYPSDGEGMCYTGSVVQAPTPGEKREFHMKIPKEVPCRSLQ